FPALPARFRSMGPEFLQALADASETAAREHTRYALERVLLRGKTGQIVATDGKHLLRQSGFRFPWQDDVLVPRLTVWGCPELAHEGPVIIGRTDTHVFVRARLWTFALMVDTTGRFPAFENVLPRSTSLTGVSGRSNSATDGRLKTSHFEETQNRQVALSVPPVPHEAHHVQSAQSGHDRDHPVPPPTWLVATTHRTRTRHRP